MKLIQLFFLLLLIFFPFGELLRWDLAHNITIKPLDTTAGVITLFYLYDAIVNKKKIPGFSLKVALFGLLGLFSLSLNSYWLDLSQLTASSLYLIRWVSYGGVLVAFYSFDSEFKKTVVRILLLDGYIIVFLGFVQYIFFQNLKPLINLGWDDHLYRIFSVFLDPNFAGAFYSLFIIFLFGLLRETHRQHRNNTVDLYLISGTVVSIIALLFTFSRSGILMFVTSSIVFFLLIHKLKYLVYVIFGVVLFMVVISPWYSIENMNPFRTASVNARLSNYSTAIGVIKENILFGVGFNAYRYAQEKKGIELGKEGVPYHSGAGVDNSYLFVLATTGLVGFAGYIFFWVALLRKAYTRYTADQSMYAIVFLASTAGVAVNAFFVNSLFFPSLMLWMWILFGLTTIKEE